MYNIDMKKNNPLQEQTSLKETSNLFNNLIISIILITVLFAFAVNLFSSVTKISLEDIKGSDVYLCLTYTLTSIAFIVALYSYKIKTKSNFLTLFKCEKAKTKSVIATILITFGMLFGLSNINNVIFDLAQKIGLNVVEPTLPQFNAITFIVILVFVCVLPPLFEEILFRNILFNNFSKSGTIFAILITSIMFSLYHMSITQTVYQLIVGVLFALIIYGGGNYLLTSISHVINNLFVVLNYYFFKLIIPTEINIVLTIVSLISLCVGVVLLFVNNKNYVKGQNKNVKTILYSSVLGISICVLFWVVGLF